MNIKKKGFRGNEHLKSVDDDIIVSQDEYREYAKEILRCVNDPIYFADHYYYIVAPGKGKIRIDTYPKQKEMIMNMYDNNRCIILASRQTGKCCSFSSIIRVKNKETGEIMELTVEEFHNLCSREFEYQLYDCPKFIESFDASKWQVETDTGWSDIESTNKTIPYQKWMITTESGKELGCADIHIFFLHDLSEVYAKDLCVGDLLFTKDGTDKVVSIVKTDNVENMYDLSLNDENHRYYTNDILSHNSTAYCIFCLHVVCFNENKKILILANKGETAKEFISRIQMAYEMLPHWIKPAIVECNKTKIKFANGCEIQAKNTTPETSRGTSADVIIFDEFAFVDDDREVWRGAYPVISSSTDTKAIIVSTPRGTESVFYEIWMAATLGTSDTGWMSTKVMWYEVPGRDDAWKKQQLQSLNYDMVAWNQEFECEFIGSTHTLIQANIIKEIKRIYTIKKEANSIPLDDTVVIDNFEIKIYRNPVEGRCYSIGADVSDGIGGDASTLHVYDITNPLDIKHCAAFHNSYVSVTEFAYILAKVGCMYNEAPIFVEYNNMGSTTINFLYKIYEYENIATIGHKNFGIFSTNPIKVEACLHFKKFIESQHINIEFNSGDLVNELEHFVKIITTANKTETYRGEKGAHDDNVMASVWALYILHQNNLEFFFDCEWINVGIESFPKNVKQFMGVHVDKDSNLQRIQSKIDKIYEDMKNMKIENTGEVVEWKRNYNDDAEYNDADMPSNLGFFA